MSAGSGVNRGRFAEGNPRAADAVYRLQPDLVIMCIAANGRLAHHIKRYNDYRIHA
jgi:hypothetical protein